MWWPELTVDVVQGDLQQLGKEGKLVSNLSTESVASSDEGEKSEWSIVTDGAVPTASSSNKFRSVLSGLNSVKRKIDRFRQNVAMTAFHAISAVPSESSVSPLDFAAASEQLDPSSLPSSARSLEQYTRLLEAVSSVCLPVTPLLLSHLRIDTRTQDVKDIQRDSVVVNGQLLTGASSGYQKIVNSIAKQITAPVDAEEIAQKSLSVANRTFSGGISLDHVLKIFGSDDLVLVVPVSAEAEPLDVTVVAGEKVLIRAHTKYRLEPADGSISENFPATVNACLLAELRPENLSTSRAYVFLDSTFASSH
jgi:hypothetical protein